MNAIEVLIAQGIPKKMAERIVSQIEKDAQPKEKKSRKWFPGISESKKVEIEIDVLILCETCGHTEHTRKTIKASANSPVTQKTGCSTCAKCPEFLDQFTRDELRTIILAGQTAAIKNRYPHLRQQIKIASRYNPESIIAYTPLLPTE